MMLVDVPPEHEPNATVAAAFAEGRVGFFLDLVFQPNEIYAEHIARPGPPTWAPEPKTASGPPVIELNGPGKGKKSPNVTAAAGGSLPSLSEDPNWDGSCPCCQDEEEYED